MKKLLFVMLLTPMVLFSQYRDTTKVEKVKVVLPGDELVKYTNHMYYGLGLTLFGGFAINEYKNSNYNIFKYSGYVFLIGGSILMWESHTHIKNCGLLLNSNGIGITYKIK